jgi:hypothetical protein
MCASNFNHSAVTFIDFPSLHLYTWHFLIAKTAASSDFEKSYKRHCLARTNVQKAREKYDCSAAQHSEDEEKCNELSREFKELRKSIVYVSTNLSVCSFFYSNIWLPSCMSSFLFIWRLITYSICKVQLFPWKSSVCWRMFRQPFLLFQNTILFNFISTCVFLIKNRSVERNWILTLNSLWAEERSSLLEKNPHTS